VQSRGDTYEPDPNPQILEFRLALGLLSRQCPLGKPILLHEINMNCIKVGKEGRDKCGNERNKDSNNFQHL